MTPDDQIPPEYRRNAYDARTPRFPVVTVTLAAFFIIGILAWLVRHGY